jgi:hypothetical protein
MLIECKTVLAKVTTVEVFMLFLIFNSMNFHFNYLNSTNFL